VSVNNGKHAMIGSQPPAYLMSIKVKSKWVWGEWEELMLCVWQCLYFCHCLATLFFFKVTGQYPHILGYRGVGLWGLLCLWTPTGISQLVINLSAPIDIKHLWCILWQAVLYRGHLFKLSRYINYLFILLKIKKTGHNKMIFGILFVILYPLFEYLNCSYKETKDIVGPDNNHSFISTLISNTRVIISSVHSHPV